MALQVGDKAPDFTLPTKTADSPKLISLSDLSAKNTDFEAISAKLAQLK